MSDFTIEDLKKQTVGKLIQLAQFELHGGDHPFEWVFKLAGQLEQNHKFSFARRLYQHLRKKHASTDEKLIQRLAKAIYKDDELPSDRRYDFAAQLLWERYGKEPEAINNQEVLGLLGSIFKRKWKTDGQIFSLLQSLDYYCRGYQLWRQAPGENNDQCYTAINYAFVCDLLSESYRKVAIGASSSDKIAGDYTATANTVRVEIVQFMLPVAKQKGAGYWDAVTLAEAYLGLGLLDGARDFLARALKYSPSSWQKESTVFQLAELCNLRFTASKAATINVQTRQQLLALVKQFALADQPEDMTRPVRPGAESDVNFTTFGLNRKVGLALSGGGFRASLFHIGMLARLAELDVLRFVEVISCVSGGSIIGAYYYLKLKQKLEEKADKELDKSDYLQIVEEISEEFPKQVQKNMRNLVLANPFVSLRLAVDTSYTRTSRVADLYEKYLYANLLPKAGPDKQIYMHDLFIRPMGDPDFNFKRDNWKRAHKVPALVLNATTLNTGHCWQFTASFMGESRDSQQEELDKMLTLRRMYYDEAPEEHQKVPLAKAVSASSCVPGLFAPVSLKNLYPNQTVQLVDGGVFDNQGIHSLLEQECNTLILSDASGQLSAATTPPTGAASSVLRSDMVLQERVRDTQLKDLQAQKQAGGIKGYMLMHLTKALPSGMVDWIGCTDKLVREDYLMNDISNQQHTPYGISVDIQAQLATIRTDLDAFHESETKALMYSGYAMTSYEFEKSGQAEEFPEPRMKSGEEAINWNFLQVADRVLEQDPASRLRQLLQSSSSLFGKSFQIPLVRNVLVALVVALGLYWISILMAAKNFVPLLITAVLVLAVVLPALRKVILNFLIKIFQTIPLLLTSLLFLAFNWGLTRLYLWWGKLRD